MLNSAVSPVTHAHLLYTALVICSMLGKMIFFLGLCLPHNFFAELPCALPGHAALSDFELVVPLGMFHSSVHPNPGKFPAK